MSLCYVTAFLDLERENWKTFQRTFKQYFDAFIPHIDLCKRIENDQNYHTIVFIDSKHYDEVQRYVGNLSNVFLIKIDEDYMKENSILWQRLDREREIMNSESFRKIVSHRLHCPETHNPKYTLINHAKIDFVNIAIKTKNCDYYCWFDFGYCGDKESTPIYPIDVNKLSKERVNYNLLNEITDTEKDIIYNLVFAPEKIGGGFFAGNKFILQEYQKLYHRIHLALQNHNIVDDDQHIVLQCYILDPQMFDLTNLGGWRKALTHFQKNISINK